MNVLEGIDPRDVRRETFEAGAGSFVLLPRGVAHARDVTSGSATVLSLTTLAGLEDFPHELHSPGADAEQVVSRCGIRFIRSR